MTSWLKGARDRAWWQHCALGGDVEEPFADIGRARERAHQVEVVYPRPPDEAAQAAAVGTIELLVC
jgi:hypothetical protein